MNEATQNGSPLSSAQGDAPARREDSQETEIDKRTYMPCRLDDDDRYVTVTICAPKFHNVNEAWEIRNMLQANNVEHHQCFL